MTFSLTQEQETRLHKLIVAGKLESAEQFIDYALDVIDASETEALLEAEAFAVYARAKLKEAQKDIDHGRVRRYTSENHHELFEDVKRRALARHKGSQERAG